MKIALACVRFMPENVRRQPWFYLNAIRKGLMSAGHEVCVLTDKEVDWGDGRRTVTMEGFRSFPQGIDPRVGPMLGKEGFDLVFWSTGLTDFFFRQGLETLEIPVIAVVTSPRPALGELLGWGSDLYWNWRFVRQFFLAPFITKAMVRRFLGSVNLKAVVFQCRETMRRYMGEKGAEGRVVIMPPPLPHGFRTQEAGSILAREISPEKPFKILYFGPPINIRGIDTLIDAMPQVILEAGGARLEILSRIEHPGLLHHEMRMKERIRKRGLTHRVEVISGILSPQEINRRISAVNVICLPFKGVISDMPIVVLEAMATGIPLVTTQVAGVSEFAQDDACQIIPPGSSKALAKAILEVFHSQGARDKGRFRPGEFWIRHDEAYFASSLKKLLEKAA
jgi:phosphatidylinositol alpha-1,6-mannosyltransferase